ncbi:hypothetical protein ACLOJK_019705 [Asimina triloba]
MRKEKRKVRKKIGGMVIRVMKMVKEERKNDLTYNGTNIRLGYIGHQHFDDGLMPDVQVWMPAESGDYGYECGYTPVLFEWETFIEPKCSDLPLLISKFLRIFLDVGEEIARNDGGDPRAKQSL